MTDAMHHLPGGLMPLHDQHSHRMPHWCWAAPVAGALLILAKLAGWASVESWPILILAIALLGGSVFSAVHHAEILAIRIGEPFGSILLALAITTLEVGLIISVMVTGGEGAGAIARDTVFAVVMIVLNGIVGLCLVLGALRHFQQEFRLQSASAILSVIATLAVVSLILPNFTLTTAGPTYAPSQLLFCGTVSLALYVTFVFIQTFRHREDFVMVGDSHEHGAKPDAVATTLSAVLLVVSLGAVILLAKSLSPIVEGAILRAGLEVEVVGVVIALVVLLPEGLTAIKAAKANRLQTALNASLGSALASIGLTIPIVGMVSVYLGQSLTLGLIPEGMVLLVLSLFVSTLTFATGRTTVLQGSVHLVIFAVFLFLTAVP
ncbi:Ca2+/H+ antiporter [Microvirga lotononidis]|uniref:Ca2+/H+ antiporter n=2 Tax=Methylobacteriaceae TaxID=119045 RepID=I4YK56_9HYPH|nr:Ca2+/H+ antiporter [Microvirga lotononidis]